MAAKEFAAAHGREPSPAEIRKVGKIAVEDYERAVGAPQASKSLDSPARADEPDSTTLGESIADPISEQERSGMEPYLLEWVEISQCLQVLTERQRWVIERRCGRDGGPPSTQAELGHQMGISYQRAAFIEREARERLREALLSRAMEPAGYPEAS